MGDSSGWVGVQRVNSFFAIRFYFADAAAVTTRLDVYIPILLVWENEFVAFS